MRLNTLQGGTLLLCAPLPSRCPTSLDQCLLNDKWAFVTECTADHLPLYILPLYIFGPLITPAPLLDVRPQL